MYTLDYVGGACPTQAEGITGKGRHFYFRYRHGHWSLRVSYDNAVSGQVIASATLGHELDGFMSDGDVIAILDTYLEGW